MCGAGRPAKSAAESAEKLASIFASAAARKTMLDRRPASNLRPSMTATPHHSLPSVVIDTNAILDWLVFREPSATFGRAIETGALRWIATPPMLLECQRLFASSSLTHWEPDAARLEAAWTRWAHVETGAISSSPLRCTDADDQMFIGLALAHRTRWLLTRDRALLKLAKRARALGVRVLTPTAWTLETDAHPGEARQS